jgi:hypothetical protein
LIVLDISVLKNLVYDKVVVKKEPGMAAGYGQRNPMSNEFNLLILCLNTTIAQ